MHRSIAVNVAKLRPAAAGEERIVVLSITSARGMRFHRTLVASTPNPPGPPLTPSFISSPLGESLRHLFLAGNPICLLPAYRERILRGSCAPGLLVLDDLPVSAGERGLVAAAAATATATAVTNADAQGGQEASRNRTAVRHGGHGRTSHEALGVVHFGVKVVGDNGASVDGLRGRLPLMGSMIRAGDGERREDAYFLVLSVA